MLFGMGPYVQRFLLLFLSLESLITYIEKKASEKSPLRNFTGAKISRTQKNKLREECIDKIWNDEEKRIGSGDSRLF